MSYQGATIPDLASHTFSRKSSHRAKSMFLVPFSYSAHRTGEPKCTSSDACFCVNPALKRASKTSCLDGIQSLNSFVSSHRPSNWGNGGNAILLIGDTHNGDESIFHIGGDGFVSGALPSLECGGLNVEHGLHFISPVVCDVSIYAMRNIASAFVWVSK